MNLSLIFLRYLLYQIEPNIEFTVLFASSIAPANRIVQIPHVKNIIAENTTAMIPSTRPAVAIPDGVLFARSCFPPTTDRQSPTIETGSDAIEKYVPKKARTIPTIPSTSPAIAFPFPISMMILLSDFYYKSTIVLVVSFGEIFLKFSKSKIKVIRGLLKIKICAFSTPTLMKNSYVTNCYINSVTQCYTIVNSILIKKRTNNRKIFVFLNKFIEIRRILMQKMEGLRQIRRKKGYSQLKVAMDLNISREALSYYETGKRNPDLDMLIAMSEYFHVSIDFLIRGKEFSD